MKAGVSVVIATYNSGKVLPKVLDALCAQDLSQEVLEILIVDGGSSDNTLEIAENRSCKVINNKARDVRSAKSLGFLCATCRYIVFLDHDEVLKRADSLSRKLKEFSLNPELRCVLVSGYLSPPNYPVINDYINDCGDPFSYFIYRDSKLDGFYKRSLKKHVSTSAGKGMRFERGAERPLPLLELGVMGAMLDLEYLRNNYNLKTKDEVAAKLPHIFYSLVEDGAVFFQLDDDEIIHYSADTIRSYLHKLKWRVVNNVFNTAGMGSAGYLGREKHFPVLSRYKKYIFPLYAISLLLPLLDSVYLAFSRRKIGYLLHFFLVLYAFILIAQMYTMRALGVSPVGRGYDGSKMVDSNE